MKKILALVTGITSLTIQCNAQQVYFAMDNNLIESISSKKYELHGVRTLPYADGVSGKALRLDGYSNYVSADLNYSEVSSKTLTFSIWLAPETYPMMNVNEAEVTASYTMIAGNIDEKARTGLGFMLSSQGDLQFQCYLKGWQMTCVSSEKLPLGQWSNLVATIDKASNKIYLYLNGTLVATGKCPYELSIGTASFMIGKSRNNLTSGIFSINTFNGLIDEIKITNKVATAEEVSQQYSSKTLSTPELAVSSKAFLDNILRPAFHGMPSHAWTNECHGMTFSNGKYHLFFQKNGNGPYMARLHWGHISSTNLLDWQEEPIAIAPGESYDIKGCWSGCVFSDEEITQGKPYIIYTGVDNAKARICMAAPTDETLSEWQKLGVIIDGRPSGLSDDFRDPYFFSANGNKYIVVGTSKNGIGACTLHKYDSGSKTWTNNGNIFFKGSSASQVGTFWEMPVVEPLGNDKYLFCCTPLNTANGVKTIYWIGTIAADGTFMPDFETPKEIEMGGMSRHGFGLLSPTFCHHNGKMIMLGIVPDKIDGLYNYQWGWAHNYSLPREVSLADDNETLIQKPVSGTETLRKNKGLEMSDFLLDGEKDTEVNGAQVEMYGKFTYDVASKQGFRFLKKGSNYAELTIGGGMVTLDITNMNRIANDNGVYDGVYSAPLSVAASEEVELHAFLDGSILDVFVNGTQAFSVRLFPTDKEATDVCLYSPMPKQIPYTSVWSLNEKKTYTYIKDTNIKKDKKDSHYYNLQGQRVFANTRGLLIHKGNKYVNY